MKFTFTETNRAYIFSPVENTIINDSCTVLAYEI